MEKYALVSELGLVPYKDAWELQKALHSLRVEDTIPDTLLLLEHPPVITKGRKPGGETNLLIPPLTLKTKGIDYFEVERGGDVTFHGPGQLVGYLIFKLQSSLSGIRPFVKKIENAIINALAEFGIEAGHDPRYTGVFVGNDKITAIGIAVKRWTSFHGFALNVNTDLSYFDLIVPCGIRDRGVTSMEKILKTKVPIEDVMDAVKSSFSKEFGLRFTAVSFSELEALVKSFKGVE